MMTTMTRWSPLKKRRSLCNDDSKNDDKTIVRMMMKLMIIIMMMTTMTRWSPPKESRSLRRFWRKRQTSSRLLRFNWGCYCFSYLRHHNHHHRHPRCHHHLNYYHVHIISTLPAALQLRLLSFLPSSSSWSQLACRSSKKVYIVPEKLHYRHPSFHHHHFFSSSPSFSTHSQLFDWGLLVLSKVIISHVFYDIQVLPNWYALPTVSVLGN